MTDTFDIVSIIKNNPITKITNTENTKLVEKLNEYFSTNEQHLFIASFYGYLNYSKNEFIINLDDIFKWIGFARKGDCKKLLVKNFKENEDFTIIKKSDMIKVASATSEATSSTIKVEHGGNNKETILMTVKTFKKLCLKADTKKADEIHNYYIKLEEILQEIISEESLELKRQIQLKINQLESQKDAYSKLQKEKDLERHNILLKEYAKLGPLVYIIKVKTYNDNKYIIKIGESRYGILQRYQDHNRNYEECIILDCFLVPKSLREFVSLTLYIVFPVICVI